MRLHPSLLASALAACALTPAPTLAGDSVEYFTRSHAAALPRLLSGEDRAWYGSLYAAIEARNWDRTEVMLMQRTDGPLHGAALASFYLHPESPRIELPRIDGWLARYPALPQTEAIVRLGQTRGLTSAPYLPPQRDLVRQPYLSKRILPSPVSDGTMPAEIAAQILDHIKNDDPGGARLLLDGIDASLSSAARAEWRQRIAWSYYIENQDANALALAQTVGAGSGPWVSEGAWTEGLAAWRLGDCDRAADAFARTGRSAHNSELSAAGFYWASRALIRCRAPEKAADQLRGAARYPETLYGMLALEQLGEDLPAVHAQPDLTAADWAKLADEEAARQAVMLAEIGRRDEADEVLRWQVRTGDPREFEALSRLARALGLAGAQTFMAYNAPRGAGSHPSLRFPVAAHVPRGGWDIDPALAFAHALQESNFRESVVSPANAIGLMQIRPIAAREYAASINMNAATVDLKDPATNLAFGQRALEALSRDPATRGALPKVMAAYNAGLTPVTRWNYEVRDQGDPLLWMESIPYWETRGYVAIVMRNYWMYLRQASAPAPSRIDLAENDWPQFPRAN